MLLVAHFILIYNVLNKFDKTGAQMSDYFYHMMENYFVIAFLMYNVKSLPYNTHCCND